MDKLSLLQTAREETKAILQTIEQVFEPQTEETLNQRPRPGKWSVLENMEHLNLACRIYYTEIEKKVNTRPNADTRQKAKSGPIGKLAINSIKPKPDGTIPRPMPTIPGFKPSKKLQAPASQLSKDNVIRQCKTDQALLLKLLDQAETADINKTRIVSSIGPIIQFRLGDAIRFLVGHNQRHMIQAKKALERVRVES